MFKQLLAAFGSAKASGATPPPTGLHSPYREAHTNYCYNLLFCDDLALFKQGDSDTHVVDTGTRQVLTPVPDRTSIRNPPAPTP